MLQYAPSISVCVGRRRHLRKKYTVWRYLISKVAVEKIVDVAQSVDVLGEVQRLFTYKSLLV